MVKFPKLFEPIKIGKIELSNRIVMPPMTTNFAKDGAVTDRLVNYYAERGRGGVGLIVVEDAIVDFPVGHYTHNCLRIDMDKFLPGLRRLAQSVKASGAKVFLNLNHAGRRAGLIENGQLLITRRMLPIAPSPIPHPYPGFVVPREMTIEEIEEVENKFVQAALRVQEAGYDGLSLNAAHMYLIDEFLSPISNLRKDNYGGSLDGRVRFLIKIIHKIKRKLGSDFQVMVYINGREGINCGITVEDAKEISCRMEAAGIDCISLSCGAECPLTNREFSLLVAPVRQPHGLDLPMAEMIKQVISIPIMKANRIITPQKAEDILQSERADLIGIGRGLIADAEWPRKAQKGQEDEIRFCIGCNHCSRTVLEKGEGLECAINASIGRGRQMGG